jgi:hypothetical protein
LRRRRDLEISLRWPIELVILTLTSPTGNISPRLLDVFNIRIPGTPGMKDMACDIMGLSGALQSRGALVGSVTG